MLKKYGVRPSRRLGQTFLVNCNIARRIVNTLGLDCDTVLEIGGGLGALTIFLARHCRYVVSIEIDKRLSLALRERLAGFDNVDIVCTDFLLMRLFPVDYIVSNVPYSISSQLVLKLAKKPTFKSAILMFQVEFAKRLLAKPGTENYGRLSVFVNLFFKVEKLFWVNKKNFYPVPEVDSMVIRLFPLNPDFKVPLNNLERFTSYIFSQRRRVLKGVLKRLGYLEYVYGLVPEYTLAKRVFQLSPQEILVLAEYLWERGAI